MTSRLLYLLQCMGPRAARTTTAANSWANVSLWRRFFEQREREEDEELQIIADNFINLQFENDGGEENLNPIEGEEARNARRSFIRQYYRGLRNAADPFLDRLEIMSASAQEAQREQRQLNQPNLAIPTNGNQDYVYRAQ